MTPLGKSRRPPVKVSPWPSSAFGSNHFQAHLVIVVVFQARRWELTVEMLTVVWSEGTDEKSLAIG